MKLSLHYPLTATTNKSQFYSLLIRKMGILLSKSCLPRSFILRIKCGYACENSMLEKNQGFNDSGLILHYQVCNL